MTQKSEPPYKPVDFRVEGVEILESELSEGEDSNDKTVEVLDVRWRTKLLTGPVAVAAYYKLIEDRGWSQDHTEVEMFKGGSEEGLSIEGALESPDLEDCLTARFNTGYFVQEGGPVEYLAVVWSKAYGQPKMLVQIPFRDQEIARLLIKSLEEPRF